ncbi:MAG: hypothetical protein WD597_05560, partial [Balneolaceae bacterium]
MIPFRQSGKSKLLTLVELELLQSCRTFKPIKVHAERYCREQKRKRLTNRKGLMGSLFRLLFRYASQEGMTLPVREKEIKPFREQLQEWAEEGLLVSESELLEEIKTLSQQRNGMGEPEAKEITMMGIPTCGRPETLRRCLDSFINNFNRHGRTPDILILDDSRDEADREKNQTVLRELSDR